LPPEAREALARLGGGVPGARWVPRENLHLTLRFIGEVDEGLADDLDAALAGIEAPGFACELTGVGHFGNPAQARVLWAGVEPARPVQFLYEKVESALVRSGLEPERRKFTPHVTLARLHHSPRDRIGAFLAEYGTFRFGPIEVDRFVLFRSFLGREAATYRAEAEYPLR
jgi:RNA 2',3'-cyclic 3'-phosphodiesterase